LLICGKAWTVGTIVVEIFQEDDNNLFLALISEIDKMEMMNSSNNSLLVNTFTTLVA